MRTTQQIQADIDAVEAEYTAATAVARKHRAMDRLQNEGGEGYSQEESLGEAALDNYSAAIKPLRNEMFAAVWTAEVTMQRRATWNAGIAAITKLAARDQHRAVRDQVERLGYNQHDIARAKALNGIA